MKIKTEEFDVIRKLVYERAGILLEAGKEYLVESRMRGLLRNQAIESVEVLVESLKRGVFETEELVVDALTTNETSFFRDGSPWELLRNKIIPEMIERNKATRKLDIWCAASSSGQEPLTLAILLCEDFPELASWHVKITATDISEDMLTRCKTGLYSQLEVSRGLPAELLVRYFDKSGVKWQVGKQLSDMIGYHRLNLTESLPMMRPRDLVMIRNVLIYFDNETKCDILTRISRVMQKRGFLMLGTAETARDVPFERQSFEKITYYEVAD
ncbi:MAG: chemotaxis protein methyltransferase CheR [Planctomycetota bacterium]|jgi:chemotaxis protein methyltransferase CheR